jgi:hypothetical protein
VIVTGVGALTDAVLMVKLGEMAVPAVITTEGGTEATAGLELARATVAPPAGAFPIRETVFDLAGKPPPIEAGIRAIA